MTVLSPVPDYLTNRSLSNLKLSRDAYLSLDAVSNSFETLPIYFGLGEVNFVFIPCFLTACLVSQLHLAIIVTGEEKYEELHAIVLQQQQNLGRRFGTSKMHLSPPVA